jgi:hypothetical protein
VRRKMKEAFWEKVEDEDEDELSSKIGGKPKKRRLRAM